MEVYFARDLLYGPLEYVHLPCYDNAPPRKHASSELGRYLIPANTDAWFVADILPRFRGC